MYRALLVIFLIVSVSLIALVMLQQGKGNNMKSSFKTGTSSTLFSSSSSGNFMTSTIAILATLFFSISLLLGNINSNKVSKGSSIESLSMKNKQIQPAIPTNPTTDIPQ